MGLQFHGENHAKYENTRKFARKIMGKSCVCTVHYCKNITRLGVPGHPARRTDPVKVDCRKAGQGDATSQSPRSLGSHFALMLLHEVTQGPRVTKE